MGIWQMKVAKFDEFLSKILIRENGKFGGGAVGDLLEQSISNLDISRIQGTEIFLNIQIFFNKFSARYSNSFPKLAKIFKKTSIDASGLRSPSPMYNSQYGNLNSDLNNEDIFLNAVFGGGTKNLIDNSWNGMSHSNCGPGPDDTIIVNNPKKVGAILDDTIIVNQPPKRRDSIIEPTPA